VDFQPLYAIKGILSGDFLFVNAYHVDMEGQTKPNLIEMAKKRRHLHLVEKLAKGKSSTPTLSKSEIRELAGYELPPGSPAVVDTQEKIAKAFGIATRTVERWIREGMPVTSQGAYDLLEIRAWRILRHQKGKKNKKNTIDWDERYREYKARLAEIAFKKVMGELIPKEIVEKELIHISLGIKRALLALPQQVASQLVGLEARQINILLASRIKEAILAIADGKVLVKKIKNEQPKIDIDNLDA
jgi:phage terminase Nu1 subunit (DNA packaging protein)